VLFYYIKFRVSKVDGSGGNLPLIINPGAAYISNKNKNKNLFAAYLNIY
jgi:hypothetical protein